MPHKKLIAIDFDGVLHSYTSPWTDAATISDPPTPGAMEFLRAVHTDPRFEVCVVSSRCRDESGKISIERWLYRHLDEAFGKEGRILAEDISVRSERPPAFLTLDDRAWCFDGTWPDLDRLAAFKPWNKRPTYRYESFETGRIWEVNSYLRTFRDTTLAVLTEEESQKVLRDLFDLPSPVIENLLLEVARRAYVAGCGMIEYHEADCQEEVQSILDDVLGRKVTA